MVVEQVVPHWQTAGRRFKAFQPKLVVFKGDVENERTYFPTLKEYEDNVDKSVYFVEFIAKLIMQKL